MSNNRNDDSQLEKNLLTLEQLTQTIDVVSDVVERLKLFLNEQLMLDSSNMSKKVELTRELLKSESELQELQKIAGRQQEALIAERIESDEDAGVKQDPVNSLSEHLDAEDLDEITETFVIEISRQDDDSEGDSERVLH